MQSRLTRIAGWVDDRTGLPSAISSFLLEDIPASAGWPHVFGSVALFLFLVQGLTGILLALNYAPTPEDAHSSLTYIVRQVSGGRLVYGLHHWGASLMIIVVFLHMAQVFIFGAFRRPREATWLAGVALLLLTFAFGLTGYLLPWNNKAYWGTVVTTRILAGLPVAGRILAQLTGSADGVGAVTFSRFYALHTLLLPAATICLIAIHVYLVRRHGITPERRSDQEMRKFFPEQLFRDFCAVFLAFLCLFLAACFLDVPLERIADPTDTSYVPRPEWYFLFLFQLLKFFPGRLEIVGSLILPALAVVSLALLPFVERTYLKILKGRVQAACVVALAFSGWLALTTAGSWGPEQPNPKGTISAAGDDRIQLPVQMIAGYAYFQSFHCEACHDLIAGPPKPGPALGVTELQHSRDWILQHFTNSFRAGAAMPFPQRIALFEFVTRSTPDLVQTLPGIRPELLNGAQVFVASACASCHKVNGSGGDIGPSLNGLSRRRSRDWIRAHFAAPGKLSPGSMMPSYHFKEKEERDLITYLLSLPE
ncbi:MAG: cytochrome b N-terminal domain-containing protein [Acidobacteriaceae bacterium]|nr:cytochrome b N-terminal domain-containing protein [Acidobacteriaceae bacterium]